MKIMETTGFPYPSFDCDCFLIKGQMITGKEKGLRLKHRIENMKDTIPARFKLKTFSNFVQKYNEEPYRVCLQYAKDFKKHRKDGIGIFLSGTRGSGKTHLACAIVDYVARMNKQKYQYDVIFVDVVSLLEDIKSNFDKKTKEMDYISRYEECDLFIIDDFGAEQSTDWNVETFFKIVNTRYAELRPTIITTNLTGNQIQKSRNNRIFSRLYECCFGIQIAGEDYRKKEHDTMMEKTQSKVEVHVPDKIKKPEYKPELF